MTLVLLFDKMVSLNIHKVSKYVAKACDNTSHNDHNRNTVLTVCFDIVYHMAIVFHVYRFDQQPCRNQSVEILSFDNNHMVS